MKLNIAPDVLAMFPDLRIGVVTGQGLDNTGNPPELATLKQGAVAAFRDRLTPEQLNEHPYILAWRETYRRFGTKPKDHRPTAEALLRRIVRGEDLPTISPIVDLYLAIETEFYLPIGGYDLAYVVGDITLRFSPGGESFIPIGAHPTPETTYAGEVVYSDAEKVLTRRWNYRDCDAAKITAASRDIALFCEATMPEIPTDHVRQCVEKLAADVGRFCGGTLHSQVITAQTGAPAEL